MKKETKGFILCTILIILSILFTILVLNFDVKPVGPNGSNVGFATINIKVAQYIGSNMTWYNITGVLGILPMLIVAIYGILGIIELVKRKSILKVDFEIILLGVFYVIIGILYLFFEKFILNYRPILIDGMLEASYPSSHTMMAIFICLSANIVNKSLIKDNKLRTIFNIVSLITLFVIVILRIISGVHWCSDIVGGVIISLTLIVIFNTVLKLKKSKD